jgi:hypothetical protein
MQQVPTESNAFYAEGYVYFGYPQLPYEEALKNISDAIDKITPYKVYTIDELEPILLKLHVDPYTLMFFQKLKNVLCQNGVTLYATFGEESCLSVYGQFKLDSNRVIINLASIIMDSKVELPEQIARVIVHELVHSVVCYKTHSIWNPDAFSTSKPLSDEDKTAIINLEIIFDCISKCPVIYEEYGLNNLNEMIAELVNPAFVAKFNQIKINCLKLQTSPEKNQILKKMFLFVTHLISGKAVYVNAHDAALKNFDVLAKTNSHPQIKFFNENLLPYFQSLSSESDPEDYTLNKVLNREDAFRFRAFDFPLLIKERDKESKGDRRILASIRVRRMQSPENYI